MITPQSETTLYEDYSTVPFIVLDKSLHTSGVRSNEFNLLDGNEIASPSMDATIHNDFSKKNP
jgi:hypothetical protein